RAGRARPRARPGAGDRLRRASAQQSARHPVFRARMAAGCCAAPAMDTALDAAWLCGAGSAVGRRPACRHVLPRRHAGPGRLPADPAALQRAPFRRRFDGISDPAAHRTGLPGIAGIRCGAAGNAGRRGAGL
ncbi:hypothetical protein XPN_0533, partial [Xanthomonas arboricola pv. pruni MAFF 301427]